MQINRFDVEYLLIQYTYVQGESVLSSELILKKYLPGDVCHESPPINIFLQQEERSRSLLKRLIFLSNGFGESGLSPSSDCPSSSSSSSSSC